MTYLSMTDKAALIRKSYKAAGIKASVRCSACSINVRVISGDFAEAERIAVQHKEVSYDDATGEILCGGNTFVFVDWHEKAVDAKLAEIGDRVAEAANNVGVGRARVLEGLGLMVLKFGEHDYCVRTKDDERRCWDVPNLMRAAARLLLESAA